MQILDRTPRELGYRMPAEWAPQVSTWITWPHKEESWPGAFEPIPAVFARLVVEVALGQRADVLVQDEAMEQSARQLIGAVNADVLARGAVVFHRIRTNDSWIRDFGPTFVKSSSAPAPLALVGWRYNAWGGKYKPWDDDAAVPRRLANELHAPIFLPEIVLEGGSIDVNGQGSVLVTEQCLLNPNRNPDLSRPEIERFLRDYLNVTNVVWLGDGIAGDDTDGHVDDLARFVAENKVAIIQADDPHDPDFPVLRDNYRRLELARNERGKPFEIITLPTPTPIEFQGQRLPASYANFTVTTSRVIVPVFGCPQDDNALAVLREAFPGRAVVGIPSRELIWGLGAFHCLTQQQPR